MNDKPDTIEVAIARAHAERRGGVWERWEQLDGTPTDVISPTQRALRARLGQVVPSEAEVQADGA